MAITNVTGIPHNQRKKLAFAYDHLGRRVTKIVSTWNGSTFTSPVTNKYVHDGWGSRSSSCPHLLV
jgi:YD repeat-containing protein